MASVDVPVALLGYGTVGAAVNRLLNEQAEDIERATGHRLRVVKALVRNLDKERDVDLDAARFTHDADEVVADPDIDLVVEVIGGIEPARSLILTALGAGQSVVTANKELLANFGRELFETAEANGVDLLFEASVCGGIPLIRPLRESLAGDRIRRITGIVNGTTNFVLTRMTESKMSFHEALAEAQTLGYAERDPTADVEGFDAAAKAAILASIAFGAKVVAGDVYSEGISAVSPSDIESARELGYVVKLLALIEEVDDEIAVRVHPAMVPVTHPLAGVKDSFNAVFIEADAAGSLMFYGRGAGGMPTASAVLGDLIDAARNLAAGSRGATMGAPSKKRARPIDEVASQFYVMCEVADRPGVLAAIASAFGEHGVSIKSMQQQGIADDARLIFVTHRAREKDFEATMAAVRQLESVHRVGSILRVVGEDE
jgi:homoserine dehydrogenase